MKNIEFYEEIKEKFKKYNLENAEKIWFEPHSQFNLRNKYLAYIFLDLYTELDYFELLEILSKMEIWNFVLKIFKKFPKKKRSFVLKIYK